MSQTQRDPPCIFLSLASKGRLKSVFFNFALIKLVNRKIFLGLHSAEISASQKLIKLYNMSRILIVITSFKLCKLIFNEMKYTQFFCKHRMQLIANQSQISDFHQSLLMLLAQVSKIELESNFLQKLTIHGCNSPSETQKFLQLSSSLFIFFMT